MDRFFTITWREHTVTLRIMCLVPGKTFFHHHSTQAKANLQPEEQNQELSCHIPDWAPHMSSQTCSYKCFCEDSSQTAPLHRKGCPVENKSLSEVFGSWTHCFQPSICTPCCLESPEQPRTGLSILAQISQREHSIMSAALNAIHTAQSREPSRFQAKAVMVYR